jgi:hypothetical protein
MKVYGVFYNHCIYESSAALQSLHTTRAKAELVSTNNICEHLADIAKSNAWCLENNMEECIVPVEIKDYEEFYVEEIEVEN